MFVVVAVVVRGGCIDTLEVVACSAAVPAAVVVPAVVVVIVAASFVLACIAVDCWSRFDVALIAAAAAID